MLFFTIRSSDPNQELISEIRMKNQSETVNALQDLADNEIFEMHN